MHCESWRKKLSQAGAGLSHAWLVIAVLWALATGCRSHCPPPGQSVPRIEPDSIREVAPVVEGDQSLRVFRTPSAGPPVILLHEVTGLSPETFRLARFLAEAHFSVYLPLLFGEPGDSRFVANGWRACTGGRFHCFHRTATNGPWLVAALLALSRRASAENGGTAVGILGMCLTGNTGLALVRDDSPVRAIVASQPALPFFKGDALGVSEEALARVREHKVAVLALRFTCDRRCPHQRLQLLQTRLGDRFRAFEIDSGPSNAFEIPRNAHSVLTAHFVDQPSHPTRLALAKVIELFNQELRGSPPSGSANHPTPAIRRRL
jgi:dienelactone hydrolase